MAAALGEALVFELHHGGPGALKAAYRALHVERIAKAGVAVDDDRGVHPLGDARQRVCHLAEGGQADVGAAKPGVGDRGARQVQGLKAGLLGHQRAQGVKDAGRQQGLGLTQPRFQCAHGRHCVTAVCAAIEPPATALSRPLPDK